MRLIAVSYRCENVLFALRQLYDGTIPDFGAKRGPRTERLEQQHAVLKRLSNDDLPRSEGLQQMVQMAQSQIENLAGIGGIVKMNDDRDATRWQVGRNPANDVVPLDDAGNNGQSMTFVADRKRNIVDRRIGRK